MSRSRALRLARKLYALAYDRAASEGEKEQATRRYRGLMARFGFDERELAPRPTPRPAVIRAPAAGFHYATSDDTTTFTVAGGRITWTG